MQGFDGKNQIYLSFCGKALLFAQLCERSFGGKPIGLAESEITTNICLLFYDICK